MRALRVIAAPILVLALLAAVPGHATLPAPERWIVAFDPGAGLPDDLGAVLRAAGVIDGVALTTIDTVAVTLPPGGIDLLRKRPDVIAARPEQRLEFHLAKSVPFIGADRARLGTPETVTSTDPTNPWTVERPAVDGSGQVIAVVDTGVWGEHPDLAGRVLAQRDFELAYAGELLLTPEQLDTFAEATGPLAGAGDDVGHGTHVAAIAAGTGAGTAGRANNNRGVAPGAKIVDLRISPQAHTTDNNVGWERNALAAYDWLLRHHKDPAFGPAGIRVVNNSWGTGASTLGGEDLDYSPFATLLPKAAQAGIVVVFSAGNSGTAYSVTETLLPTGHPDVITVAAGCHPGSASSGCTTIPDKQIANFSSRGPAVDVTAPGVDIVAAVNASSGQALGWISGDFSGSQPEHAVTNRVLHANFSGTSMSGPHVAGLAALLLQADPTLTPPEVRIALAATSRDLLKLGRDVNAGWGMVDAPAALTAAARHAAGTPLVEQFPTFDTRP